MPVLPLSRIPAHHASVLGADAPAVIHGDEIVTWGELDRESTSIAWGLKQRGVGKDDLVTLALPNGGDLYKLSFAIWKAGAIPHVVAWKLPHHELQGILEVARPKVLVTETAAFNAAFGGVTPASLKTAKQDALPEIVASHWKAMSSGGSTGRPKIIVDHMPAQVDTDGVYLQLPHRSVVLNPGPLYHNAPFSFTHYALFQGNTVVGMKKFDAEESLQLIDRYKAAWVNMVPTMMARIWRLPEDVRIKYDVSSLKVVWHMAAPMPVWLKESWIGWLGPETIWELYAGTERMGATVINGVDWLTHKGSVGRANPGSVVRIRDEAGRDLAVREVGEIYLGQETGETTYHYLGADRRMAVDGLESIGDFGWLDEEGFLYLADRRTDLILSGGANIYPAEVESALMEHPGVDVAVVIGLPHEDLGAAVHAIIRPRAEAAGRLTEADLGAFVRERLSLYKTPRSYEFTGEELRDDAGKVRRSKLREDRLSKPPKTGDA